MLKHRALYQLENLSCISAVKPLVSQGFGFSHLLFCSSILALLVYLYLSPVGEGGEGLDSCRPRCFPRISHSILGTLGHHGNPDPHLPWHLLSCQHWQWCGQSSPHLLPTCASLGKEGLCTHCNGPKQEDSSPFCSLSSHFLLSRHSAASWALNASGLWCPCLSMDTTAQSADSHKSVALPRAPCSRRVKLSPQIQGQTLPVLSQLTQTYSNSLG